MTIPKQTLSPDPAIIAAHDFWRELSAHGGRIYDLDTLAGKLVTAVKLVRSGQSRGVFSFPSGRNTISTI